jgi:flavodoxin I
MKALVVYDSFFSNTEKIAQAIGEALRPQGEVGIFRVADIKVEQVAGVEVFIVGSPTR